MSDTSTPARRHPHNSRLTSAPAGAAWNPGVCGTYAVRWSSKLCWLNPAAVTTSGRVLACHRTRRRYSNPSCGEPCDAWVSSADDTVLQQALLRTHRLKVRLPVHGQGWAHIGGLVLLLVHRRQGLSRRALRSHMCRCVPCAERPLFSRC